MKRYLNLKQLLRVATILILAICSGYVAETVILFGSFYLLKSQAGGLQTKNHAIGIGAMVMMWAAGMLFRTFDCPYWLLMFSLLLVNFTVFLFAPATNAANPEKDMEIRKRKKNRAFFITVCLSFLVVLFRGTAPSTLLLTSIMLEASAIWFVILLALLNNDEIKAD